MPIYACNMKCDYCYIKQNENRSFTQHVEKFKYSPLHIANCLRPERLGGKCLINLCAGGETFLSHETVELALLLLSQGHYVMIVNNGTISKYIRELCDKAQSNCDRLWFRFSLHYLELLRLNKLQEFFDNVNYVKKAGCSIAVEMVASDDYIPHIEDIKNVCLKEIGSLPEISIARRESDFSTLTDLSNEEYQKVWGSFNSKSFDFKNHTVGIKRKEYCYAGDWTITLDLGNGYFSKCYSQRIQNIFKDPNEKIKFEAMGKKCPLPYCHNSHIFMTFGDIPSLDFPTFADIRDKRCADGSYWLTKKMHDFIDCKLSSNNKKYSTIKKAGISLKHGCKSFKQFTKKVLKKIKG